MLGVSKKEPVEFCERCSTVCDRRCRSKGVREQGLAKATRFGPRL